MAHKIDVEPEQFWKLTPWQFGKLVQASIEKREEDHDHSAWLMYHGAVLGRVQKMPPLKQFLSGKKPVKILDETVIMTHLKAYQKRYEAECQS